MTDSAVCPSFPTFEMLAWCLASRFAILGLLISEKSRPPGKYVNGFFSFPMEPAMADGT